MCVYVYVGILIQHTLPLYISLSHCKRHYKLRNQQSLLLTSSRSSMNCDNIFMFFFSHGTEYMPPSSHALKVSVPQKAERSIKKKKKLAVSSNSINSNSRRTLLSPASFLSRVPFLSVLLRSFRCPLSVRVTWNVFGFFPSSSSLSALSLCSSPRSSSFVPCRECFHSCVVLSLGKTRV